MKKRKDNKFIVVVIIITIIICGFFMIKKLGNRRGDVIIIKDNVTVISEQTPIEKQPIKITENEMVFNVNPNLKENQIVVSGIIDSAPNGFIRKVVKTDEVDSLYIVKTENAVLTDVFEKAHIVKSFALTENGAEEISEDTVVKFNNNSEEQRYVNLGYTNDTFNNSTEQMGFLDANVKYQFLEEFQYAKDELKINGEVGFKLWIDFELDINHGNVLFGIVAHSKSGGGITIGCTKEYKIEEYTEEIFEKLLPNMQFYVGNVPIVITNEVQADVTGKTYNLGSIESTFQIDTENAIGFQYDSKKNKVEQIDDIKYLSNGLQWNTEAKFISESSAEIQLHLVTKLYDSTGADIAIGVEGSLEGSAITNFKDINGIKFVGKVDSVIQPKLGGKLVVEAPVIDKQLTSMDLFEYKLKPLWENHWESSKNWKKEFDTLEKEQKLHYENVFFSIDFPADWEDKWKVSKNDESTNEIVNIGYNVSYMPKCDALYGGCGGGAYIQVIDIKKAYDSKNWNLVDSVEWLEKIGQTSQGYYIYITEAGAGIFDRSEEGAVLTLK